MALEQRGKAESFPTLRSGLMREKNREGGRKKTEEGKKEDGGGEERGEEERTKKKKGRETRRKMSTGCVAQCRKHCHGGEYEVQKNKDLS